MKIKITYPTPPKRKRHYETSRNIMKKIIIISVVIMPFINLFTGPPAWSIVGILGVLTLWKFVFAPDMVEYNMMSQTVKALVYITAILASIEIFIAPGWANFVIPLVFIGAFLTSLVFFFININQQKQGTMPLVWLTILSIILVSTALLGYLEMNWPMIVLGVLSALLSITGLVLLWKDLLMEFKKRFHIQ